MAKLTAGAQGGRGLRRRPQLCGRGRGRVSQLSWPGLDSVSPLLTSSPSLSQQRKKNPNEVVYNVSRGGGIFFLGNLGGRAGEGLWTKVWLLALRSLPDLTLTSPG